MQHDLAWHNPSTFDFSQLSLSMAAWLTKPYVLSQAFKRHCEQFSVYVLAQTEAAVFFSEEAAYLSESHGFIREVYLQGDGQPWSYGRITVPQATLGKHQNLFTKVGARPFTEAVLYDNLDVVRGAFQYCCLRPEAPLFQRAAIAAQVTTETLYSRRSLFYVQDAPLLVTEIFLPDQPPYQDD